MDTAQLSGKGQLVIPKAVRDQARVVAGAQFSVRYVDGEIRLRPLQRPQATSLDQVAGCLARPTRRPLTEAQTQAAIRTRLKARHAP